MKFFITIAFLLCTSLGFAAETKNTAAPSKIDKSKTNVSFDELLIQGQFHFSDEAVITVENDKVLDALLGVRKDFKDRIQQSASR